MRGVLLGDDHRRARKIMLPGFNGPEARTYLPIFLGAAERVSMLAVYQLEMVTDLGGILISWHTNGKI